MMDTEEVVTETAVLTAVEQGLTALLEAGYGDWTVRRALLLLLLRHGEGNEARHLAPRLKAAKSLITRAADKFEAESLVERRQTRDKRVSALVLTAKGRRIMRMVEGS
jgi:DNA-binding MarR family transcriptional regulator